MVEALPSDDVLYAALLARDPGFDGVAYAAVTSTGIFCRMTCPARKPKREHALFFGTVSACLKAGFRPCKRCRPLAPITEAEPMVRALLNALEEEPGRRWREEDISAMGFDPSTVRRAFKRHLGVTFLKLARLHRIRSGARTLSSGARVIEAQLDAGFESGSGFRAAFARILGRPPATFRGHEPLKADWLETPLGTMIAIADENTLYLLEFFDRKALPGELARLERDTGCAIGMGRVPPVDRIEAELAAYFAGQCCEFRTPLARGGSPFLRTVWDALRRIPPGETRSYSDIAAAVGAPRAVRAVARANGLNRIAIAVPCHRVVGKDGALAGYGGGLWRKRWLLQHERVFTDTGTTQTQGGIRDAS